MKPTIQVNGIVLRKVLRGESGVLFHILSKKDGLISCVKRVSSKKSSILPDLFDEVFLILDEMKSSDLKIVREFDILKNRIGLASRYESFIGMSEMAMFIFDNAKYLESCEKVYDLFEASLDSALLGASCVVLKIKFFYVLAKHEGYPVKESFATAISSESRVLLQSILSTPSLYCNSDDGESIILLNSLIGWMRDYTDFLVSELNRVYKN